MHFQGRGKVKMFEASTIIPSQTDPLEIRIASGKLGGGAWLVVKFHILKDNFRFES